MKITSAGLQSELIFHHFNGEVSDLGDCISIHTPRNPAYWDGNKLVFPEPPKLGDFPKWMARFDQEFADPKVRHYSFQWLSDHKIDKPALAAFTDAGFRADDILVLTAQSVQTTKPAPDGIEYRQILTDAEWNAVIDAQTEQGFPDIPKDQYRVFKEATFADYRNMSEQGLGHWWGAFKGSELVADLGLFFGEGLGRFQSVETSPKHQRQGICRAFICHVSNWAFDKHPNVTLMLHADAGEIAEGIYRSVGYKVVEKLEGVVRPPQG